MDRHIVVTVHVPEEATKDQVESIRARLETVGDIIWDDVFIEKTSHSKAVVVEE